MTQVVLVTHYYSPHRGGVEAVAQKLAEALCRGHGFNITWFASATDQVPDNLPRGVGCIPVAASNFMERRFGLPFPIWTPLCIIPMWHEIQKANLVHLHDYLYMGNILAFVIARCRGKPVVVTQHIGEIPYDSGLLRWTLGLLNRTLGRWVLTRAQRTIFISPVVRDYFSTFCQFRHEPQHIPNGVDNNIFTPLSNEIRIALRQQHGYASTTTIFLFVGRFVEKKGLPMLRHLAVLFPQVQFLFAGEGPLDPDTWQLNNTKVFRGRSDRELAELYRLADLLLLPSKGEGFPLVIQEALACGTPVLTSDETALGNPALVDMMMTEPVETTQAEALWQRRIEKLLNEPQALQRQRDHLSTGKLVQPTWSQIAADYAAVMKIP